MDVNWTWKRLLSTLGMQNTILRYVLFINFSKDWIDPLGDSMALYHLVHEVQFKLKRLTRISLSLFHTSLITLYCLHIFCQSLHFVKFFASFYFLSDLPQLLWEYENQGPLLWYLVLGRWSAQEQRGIKHNKNLCTKM